MKFNITYMGDINFLNFQRDWLLLIAYGLQDLGHAVVISHNELDSGKTINIICHGVHNLAKDKVHHIINSNVNYGVIPGASVGLLIIGPNLMVNQRVFQLTLIIAIFHILEVLILFGV